MPLKSDAIRTKGVHVKLDRATHANFKSQLAQQGLTMQEAFEEFARLVGTGNATAHNILDRLIRAQVKEELATVGLKSTAKKRQRRLSELDPERLYDLINEGDLEETSGLPLAGGHNEAV